MNRLRDSLQELVDASARRALLHAETPGGQSAWARMTLLLSLIDRLDSDGSNWEGWEVLPETVPLLCLSGPPEQDL